MACAIFKESTRRQEVSQLDTSIPFWTEFIYLHSFDLTTKNELLFFPFKTGPHYVVLAVLKHTSRPDSYGTHRSTPASASK